MNAPGADDNATGVATVLEVFRVLVQSGFKSNRTLQFMTYAAEEVGLLGSQEIANQYNKEKKNVVGVMQLDMTGFPGSGSQVVFMTDFVSAELTQFSARLMDAYVKAKWSTDKCGYACSDHASWNKAGYPAVMPFESKFSADNKDIHTTRDVISKLDFNHSLLFARLGLSFMAELSN
jgi:leucyl aminopeptidase